MGVIVGPVSCVRRSADITGPNTPVNTGGDTNGTVIHNEFKSPVSVAYAMEKLGYTLYPVSDSRFSELIGKVGKAGVIFLQGANEYDEGLIFRIQGKTFPAQSVKNAMVVEGDVVQWAVKNQSTGQEYGVITIAIMASMIP